MNWTMIGALGEILAASVVLVSVLYLALQVKQASTQARIATYQRLQSDFVQLQNLVASDPDTAAVLEKGFRSLEQLTTIERLRFSSMMLTLFRGWETALRYHRRDWIDLESQTMVEPGVLEWWNVRDSCRAGTASVGSA